MDEHVVMRGRRGASAVEYALLLVLVAVGAAAGFKYLGGAASQSAQCAGIALGGGSGHCPGGEMTSSSENSSSFARAIAAGMKRDRGGRAQGEKYAQNTSGNTTSDAVNPIGAGPPNELKVESGTTDRNDPYKRTFELSKPSKSGGKVIQRIKKSVRLPNGEWDYPVVFYEEFSVEPGAMWASSVDTFGAKSGESVRIEAEATFYEGMTDDDLKGLGFYKGAVPDAGNRLSKGMNYEDERLSLDKYNKSSGTVTETWEWPPSQK